MRAVAALQSGHPGSHHLASLLDCFQFDGPNGKHDCLVLELLGRHVQEFASCFKGSRLPGKLAKSVAKQVLLGLDCLHQRQIAHGGRPVLATSSRT